MGVAVISAGVPWRRLVGAGGGWVYYWLAMAETVLVLAVIIAGREV